MGGSTKVIDTTPQQTQKLRGGVVDWLMTPSQGQGQLAGRGAAAQGGRQMQPFGGDNNVLYNSDAERGFSAGGPQPQGGMPQGFAEWQRGYQAQEPQMSGGYPGQAYAGPQSVIPGMGGGSPYDRMFANDPGAIPRTEVNRVGDVAGIDRGGIRDVNAGNVSFDPSQIGRINPNQIQQVGDASQNIDIRRNMIGNVTPGQLNNVGTQSVDQLGGANSAFFRNMMAQLQPAFDEQRSSALAAAKEGAGNLSGSGYANYVGSALNRSLGDEQARLADYATQGLGMEVNRQLGVAGLNNTSNIARFQGDLDAQRANQGMDSTFINQMLQRGQLGLQGQMANQDAGLRALLANQGADIESGRLGLQAGGMNQDANLRAGMANQGMDANWMSQEMQRRFGNQSAGINQNQFQGQMDQQRLMQEYQTRAQMGDANAQRFLQMLMAQSTAGVTPSTVQQSGGIGSFLGTALGGVAGSFLGPLGTAAGSKLGSSLFGGGK